MSPPSFHSSRVDLVEVVFFLQIAADGPVRSHEQVDELPDALVPAMREMPDRGFADRAEEESGLVIPSQALGPASFEDRFDAVLEQVPVCGFPLLIHGYIPESARGRFSPARFVPELYFR